MRAADAYGELPDPGQANGIDELAEQLRLLKTWAGNPSYSQITSRVNATWRAAGRPATEQTAKTTVVSCFRPGRRRINADLVVAVVAALHPDVGYVAQWRQALQIISGRAHAASQVRVQDTLPPDLTAFTGRTTELDQLRRAMHKGVADGGTVVITAIAGMAGVGKTQLAIHTGHLLARDGLVDRVLFVNLRGFHPDPAQPPADPAAVLDGFLRLLGLPGQQVPHSLRAKTMAYRDRLAGTRTLIVLDNAAGTGQVRPLLPNAPGCLVLITSRRDLSTLDSATHLPVDVFTSDEAAEFVGRATIGVPAGPDPRAPARIAHRCGHLPLALSLVVAHIQARSSWTLTDHADRLDEHHQHGRLETGVQVALELSYQDLHADRQRLLRLVTLHPGQEFDVYAAAALAGSDLVTAQDTLGHLCRDHLLQQTVPGRYTLHDLIRAYAAARAGDDDPPAERRAALTRLFDYYLATTAAAMDTLYPAEIHRRPRVAPAVTPIPDLSNPDTARPWLDIERPTLVAVAATHGWPTRTIALSATLDRYLDGGHHSDALTIHHHGLHAARQIGDLSGQANALTGLGTVHMRQGRYEPAVDRFRQALTLFQQSGDLVGQARSWHNLGVVDGRRGSYQPAAKHFEQALTLFRQLGDRTGEAHTQDNLGAVMVRLGCYQQAAEHFEQVLALSRQIEDRHGEARTLNNLGYVQAQLGQYVPATEHLKQALALCRSLGNRTTEAWTLDSLGGLHLRLAQPTAATTNYQLALAIFREAGERKGEAGALNGLGEAAHAAGLHDAAITEHNAALTIAAAIGARDQEARAHAGLGRTHHQLGDILAAQQHFRYALTFYTDLGAPEAEQIRHYLNGDAVGG